MTDTVTEQLTHIAEVNSQLIDVELIHMDHDFNCRHRLERDPRLKELKESIEANGLEASILVRPNVRQHSDKPDTHYDVIAGFRRLTCFIDLELPAIPARIVEMDDDKARQINLQENIQRANLDQVEEAYAIKPFFDEGMTMPEIEKLLTKSHGWLMNRKAVLGVPKYVQDLIRKGKYFDTNQIRSMPGMGPKELQVFVTKCEDWVVGGCKGARPRREVLQKRNKPVQRVSRKNTEIQKMMADFYDIFGSKYPEVQMVTKAMAWCSGAIDTYDLHLEIEKFAKLVGTEYIMPISLQQEATDEANEVSNIEEEL